MTCTANDFQDNNGRMQEDTSGGIATVEGAPEQTDLEQLLPLEVCLHILEFITEPRDLLSVALQSRYHANAVATHCKMLT